MEDAADLFTRTARTLRDNTVVELQKSNHFLRRQLAQNTNNPFFKYKVIIFQHQLPMQPGNIFPETDGILISIKDYNVTVLFKNSNNENIIKIFHLNHIKIVDDRVEKYFFN
tara:strand:- start:75 stop:410 length:336 start_codon:yes stop_codon:yes gene_type:complete